MAQVDWRLEGEWIKNCNCAYGCPCDSTQTRRRVSRRLREPPGRGGQRHITSSGAIRYETKGSHSTLAHVIQTPEGVEA